MKYEVLDVGAFGANCIALWDVPSEAVIIDPGAEAPLIEALIEKHSLHISAYWLTHGHIDHISALGDLLANHPAPVHVHPADAEWAFTGANRIPPYLRIPKRPENIVPWERGPLKVGPFLSARVLPTPGHTPGSLCFYFENEHLLFSGDTLFMGSVGRTDLPGGDATVLAKSLKTLAKLPREVQVIPGHGPSTTIADELRYNPFLG